VSELGSQANPIPNPNPNPNPNPKPKPNPDPNLLGATPHTLYTLHWAAIWQLAHVHMHMQVSEALYVTLRLPKPQGGEAAAKAGHGSTADAALQALVRAC